MSRAATLLFAIFAYAVFFATFLYLICFVGNFSIAPVTVDRSGPASPVAVAVVIDLILISMFGLQHSVMARQGFKRAWTRIVPHQAERSVYVLVASLMLIVLFLFWRPIEGTLWDAHGTAIGRRNWSRGRGSGRRRCRDTDWPRHHGDSGRWSTRCGWVARHHVGRSRCRGGCRWLGRCSYRRRGEPRGGRGV